MAKFTITAPDGNKYTITAPEDATEDHVLEYAKNNYQSLGKPAESVARTDSWNEGKSFMSGVVQGFRDPLDAGAQLMEQGAKAIGVNTDKVNQFFGMPSADEARINAAAGIKDTLGEPSTAGRITGNLIATAPLAGAIPSTAATLGGRMALGAAAGGAYSSLQPVEKGEFWPEKAMQVGTGAGLGGMMAPIVSGISSVISPKASDRARTLLKENVTPTPGQLLGGNWKTIEDKLTSVPLIGDAINSARRKSVEELNRAVYARALKDVPGSEVPQQVGREGVAAVKGQLSSAYDDLLSRMKFAPDAQFSSEMGSLQGMVGSLPKREAKAFNEILQRELYGRLTPGGTVSGETLKTIESQLGAEAKNFSGATDAYQRKLGEALSEALRTFRGGIERSNPQQAVALANLNKGYSNYSRLRDAASRSGSAEGVVTPAQLAAAVRAGDKSVGKGATATGQAMMQDLADEAKAVLGNNYPDSGTAGRMMLGGIGLGGGMFLSPAATGAAAISTLPYLPGGRQAMAALIAKRPASARLVADALRRMSVPASLAAPELGLALSEGM